MKKTLKTAIYAIIILVLLLTVWVSVSRSDESAHASHYELTYDQNVDGKMFYKGGEEYTVAVILNSELYTYFVNGNLFISYQKVKVNRWYDTYKDYIPTTTNGKFPESYEVIGEEEIAAEEIVPYENPTDNKAAYFLVSTTVNCMWQFTIKYRVSSVDEFKNDYSSRVLCCGSIDTEAPKVKGIPSQTAIEGSAKWRYTVNVSDGSDTDSAASGIKKITLYKQEQGKDLEMVDEKVFESKTSYDYYGDNYSYVCKLDNGVVSYYIDLEDQVGNRTGRMLLASFTDQAYNKGVETNVSNALAEMEEDPDLYAREIFNALSRENTTYRIITRDTESTEEEKERALDSLRKVYAVYREAKDNYDAGIVDCEITVNEKDVMKNFEVVESSLFNAFDFLKRGERLQMVVSLSRNVYSSSLEKEDALDASGLENAKEMYAISITTTASETTDVKSGRNLSAPIVLKAQLDPGEKVKMAAVQKIPAQDGEDQYKDCNVVIKTNGEVLIHAYYSSGPVYLFVSDETKAKPYWLFAFTAIPLIAGGIFLAYALVRMKKIKAKALEEQKEEEEKKEETNKRKKGKNGK